MSAPDNGERQVCGGFRGATGKAVARGACEGRLIAVGKEGLGKHPACGVSKFYALRRRLQPK
jgi:hypothetical protein